MSAPSLAQVGMPNTVAAISCVRCSKCFDDGDDAFIAMSTPSVLVFLCNNCIYQNKIEPCQRIRIRAGRGGDDAAIDSSLLFRYIFQTNSWADAISRSQNVRQQLSMIDNIITSQFLFERNKQYELEQQLLQSRHDIFALKQLLNEKECFLEQSMEKNSACNALLSDRERDIQLLKEGLNDKERKCNAFEQAYRTIVEQLSSKNARSAQQYSDAAAAVAGSGGAASHEARLYDHIRPGASAANSGGSATSAFSGPPHSAVYAREGGRGAPKAEAAGYSLEVYSCSSNGSSSGGSKNSNINKSNSNNGASSFFETRASGASRRFNQG